MRRACVPAIEYHNVGVPDYDPIALIEDEHYRRVRPVGAPPRGYTTGKSPRHDFTGMPLAR